MNQLTTAIELVMSLHDAGLHGNADSVFTDYFILPVNELDMSSKLYRHSRTSIENMGNKRLDMQRGVG